MPPHHLPLKDGTLPGRTPTPPLPSTGRSPCRWSKGTGRTASHRPGSPRGPPGWCRGTCAKMHGHAASGPDVPQDPAGGQASVVPALRRPPGRWLPAGKGVTVRVSQHFTWCESAFLNIRKLRFWFRRCGLSRRPLTKAAQVVMGAIYDNDMASPRFSTCAGFTLQAASKKTLFPPCRTSWVKTNPRRVGKMGSPRSKCGSPFSQPQYSSASGAAVPHWHGAGVTLVKQQIPRFPPEQPPQEAAMRTWDLVWSHLQLPLPESRGLPPTPGLPL